MQSHTPLSLAQQAYRLYRTWANQLGDTHRAVQNLKRRYQRRILRGITMLKTMPSTPLEPPTDATTRNALAVLSEVGEAPMALLEFANTGNWTATFHAGCGMSVHEGAFYLWRDGQPQMKMTPPHTPPVGMWQIERL